MNNFKKISALFLILSFSALFLNDRECLAGRREKLAPSLPFETGEQLTYEVYYGKVKIGRSVLTFKGEKKLEGKPVYHINFSTDVHAFEDTEDIYADKKTFLPFRVFRRLKQVGRFPVKIEETYNQKTRRIKIKKRGRFLSREFTIEKDAPIQNAILLTYLCRTSPDITGKQKLRVILPTKEFDLAFTKKEFIATPLGRRSAYVFESIPSKFTFWLSADEKRIPLKIKSLNFKGYSLIIKKIK